MKTTIILITFLLLTSITNANVTIIHNINGYTFKDFQLMQFDTLAFENKRVVAIGFDKDIFEKFPKATIIDGNRQTLIPGLHDAQVDIMQSLRMKSQLNLTGITTLEQTLITLQTYIDKNPEKQWIEGYGWNHLLWKNKEYPSALDLDSLSTEKPIVLRNHDRSTLWVNTKTMKIARAQAYKNNPIGGRILFNSEGKQKGIFIDNALRVIQPHVPRLGNFITHKLIKTILTDFSKLGITSFDDTGIDFRTYNLFKSIALSKKNSIRINAAVSSVEKALDIIMEGKPLHDDKQFNHVHAIHNIIDGEFKTNKAALLQPYEGRKSQKGSARNLKNSISTQINSGWQVVIQANGDYANKIALEQLAVDNEDFNEKRNKIENTTLISKDDLKKIAGHNLIYSVRPYQALSDISILESKIGLLRVQNSHPWQSLIKNGAKLIAGSGYPHYSANPFLGIQALVSRKNGNNKSRNNINLNENLTIEQAFAAYTINAAYANRQEELMGSLEVGKWADFILINQNIFKIPTAEIKNTKVLQTWFNGKKIYQSPLPHNKQKKVLKKS